MKFEPNLQSYGIPNLTAYEAVYAEVLKLCHLEPTSTIFAQYYSDLGMFSNEIRCLKSLQKNISGVLPLIAAQHADQSYGIDPSRFAIQTAKKTQEKYRKNLLI